VARVRLAKSSHVSSENNVDQLNIRRNFVSIRVREIDTADLNALVHRSNSILISGYLKFPALFMRQMTIAHALSCLYVSPVLDSELTSQNLLQVKAFS